MKIQTQFITEGYTVFKAGGKIYAAVPVYDLPECYAVRGTGDIDGKEIEFLL